MERDNLSLRVSQRQADGRWRIVTEMYNDANREGTYLDDSWRVPVNSEVSPALGCPESGPVIEWSCRPQLTGNGIYEKRHRVWL